MATRRNQNIKPSSKNQHTPNNTWFSNALKSMGLSSMEMIKDMAPSIYEFTTSTAGATSELVKNIRTGKISTKRIADSISNTPQIKLGKNLLKNALEDAKTGKFINPERQKQLDKEFERRLMGGDIDEMFEDMEHMFDDVSFDDDLDDEKVVVNNNNYVASGQQDNANTYATLMVSDSIQKQTKSQMEASKASIDTMVSVAANQMMLTKQLGNNILGELGSINENLSALISYQNENMTKYIEASLEYYSQTAPKQEDPFSYEGSSKLDPSSIYSKGAFNVKNYANIVKQNLKKTYGDSLIGSAIDMISENPEMFIANPIGLVLPSVLGAMVPTVLKDSIKHLDNTFKDIFPTMLGKLGDLKKSPNGLLSTLGSIFGITEERKNTFKLNKFEKGTIPFDGVTKHAIVEIIPTYLRKILAAVSNNKEIAYDWDTGRYATVDSMRENVYESIRSDTISQFRNTNIGDELDKYKEMLTEKDQERFNKLLDNFFVALEKRDKHFDPFDTKDGDPFKDVYKNIDADYGVEMGAFLRSAFRKMDKGAIMKLNAARQSAMRSRADMMKIMEEDPYSYNLFAVASDMNVDEAVQRGSSNARQVFGATPSGKKGRKPIDLLMDIKAVLYRGINVRVTGKKPYKDDVSVSASAIVSNASVADEATVYEDYERESRSDEGKYTSDLAGSHKSEKDFERDMDRFNQLENTDFEGNQIDTTAETGHGAFASVRRKLNRPGVAVANKVKAMDNLLYSFVFGSGEQTFDMMLMSLGEKIGRFRDKVVEDYVQPLADKLFGTKDDNGFSRDGLFSGAQNSIKDLMLSFRHEFSGKEYIDSKGEKHEQKDDSETAIGIVKNTFHTLKNGVHDYLFGKKEDGEDPEGKSKGIVNRAIDSIKQGFNIWNDMIFGEKFDENGTKKDAIEGMKKTIQERAPKTIAGGVLGAGAGAIFGTKLGLISSLFLPGGPVSGAIVGSTVGFLSQSERFKEFLFGKEEDGEHIEGLISKKTQDFFKENKSSIIGGATFGTIKSFILPGHGLLASVLGGPLAGALVGAGWSMLKKSEAVQELLYGKGEEGEEGYKKGIVNAIKDKFKTKDGKNKFGLGVSGAIGGMLTGTALSQFGIIGASLFGPVTGAVAGLTLGIASSSDKFKDFMFGEYDDEEHKRQGGLLGKMGNYLNLEVLQPMKLKIQETALDVNEFFARKVLSPIQDAIDPFAYQLKLVGESISNKFHEITDTIADGVHEFIVQPISDGINKYLLDPMKSFANTVFGAIFGMVKGIVAAPFKFLSYVTNGMVEDHKEKSFNQERDKLWQRDHSKGEKGFKGVINSILGVGTNIKDTVKMYVDKDTREAAQSANAAYIDGREERINERNRKLDDKFGTRRAELERKQAEYRAKQRNARDNGYVDGNDSSTDEDEGSTTSRRKRREKKDNSNKRQGFFSRMFRGNKGANSDEDETPTINPETEESEDKSEDSTTTGRRRARATRRRRREEQKPEDSTPTINPETVRNAKKETEDKGEESSKEEKVSPSESAPKVSRDQVKTPSGNVSPARFRSSVMKNVTDIRNEVKGQLNGVGINISKIRRILVKRLKDDDTDVAGQDNASELSLMDRIMYALSNPLKSVIGVISAPFKILSETAGRLIDTGRAAIDWVKALPGKIMTGIGNMFKGIGHIVGKGLEAVLSIPKAVANAGVEVVKGTSKIISAGVTGLLKGASTLLNGAASLVGSVLKTTGDMIKGGAELIGSALAGLPAFIEGSAKAIGEVAKGILGTIGTVGKGVVKMIGTTLKGTVEVIGATLKTATNVLVNAAKGALSILGLPFKAIGGLVDKFTGKDKKQTVIHGGTIDKIEDPVKVINGDKPLHVIIDDSKKILSVKQVGTTTQTGSFSIFDSDDNEEGNEGKGKAPNKKGKKIAIVLGSIAASIGAIATSVAFISSRIGKNTSSSGSSGPTDTDETASLVPEGEESSSPIMPAGTRSKIIPTASIAAFKAMKRKKKEDEQKKENEQKFEVVTRKTSEYLQAQKAAEAKEKKQENAQNTTLSLLTNIRDDTREHKSVWNSIFSKKGLITGGLILAAPLILKLLKFLNGGNFNLADIFSNFFRNSASDAAFGWETSGGLNGVMENAKEEASDWEGLIGVGDKAYDENGKKKNIFRRTADFIIDNGEFTQTSETRLNFLRGTAKNAAKFGKNAVNGAKNLSDKLTKITGKELNVGAKLKTVGSKIGNKLGGAGNKIKTAFMSKLNQKGTQVLDESGKVIASFDQSMLNKCKGLVDDAGKALQKAFNKLFSKFGKKEGGKVSKLISKALKVVTPKRIMSKAPKFLKVLGKGAAAAFTLAASEGFWAVLGGISGATNAANLFQVDNSYVDAKMVAISAVFRGLLGTTVGSVVDIINDIAAEVLSFNLIHEISLVAYDILSDDDDYNKLMKGKEEFKEEYLNAVEKEYQDGYAKYKEEGGDEDYETWKETSGFDVTSFSDYNNHKNKSIFGKAWDGIKTGVKGIGKGIGWVGDKIGQGVSWVGNKIGQGASWVGNKIKDGASWLSTTVVNGAKQGWSNLKENFAGGMFNNDKIKSEFGLADGQKITLSERMSMGISDIAKTLTFGKVDIDPEAVNGAILTVKNKSIEGWKDIQKSVSDTWKSVKKSATEAPGRLDSWLGNMFGYVDDDGNPIKLTEGYKLAYDKTMKAISDKSNQIKKDASKWWTDTKQTISDTWNKGKDSVNKAKDTLDQSFGMLFGFQDDEGKPLKLSQGLVKTGKNAMNQIEQTFTDIKNNASKTWSDFKTTMSNGWKDFKDGVSNSIENTNASLGSFFGFQDDKGNALSMTDGLKYNAKHAFEVGVQSVKNIKDGAVKFWNDSKKNVSKFFSDAKDNLNKAMDKTNQWFGQLFGFKDENGKDLSLTEGISKSVNAFTKGVNSKWTSLTDWFNNLGDKLIQVSRNDVMASQGGGMGPNAEGGFGDSSDMKNNFSMYAQGDPRWGSNAYCGSTIKAAGCGPTSMAMIASSLLGKKYLPSEMASKSTQWGTYDRNAGTTWEFFGKAGKYYGIDVSQGNASKEAIINSLKAGRPIILSGNTKDTPKDLSPFTPGGHFVVVHGLSPDGNQFLINDPRGDSYSKLYTADDVLHGTKQMWTFKAKDGAHPDPTTGNESIQLYNQLNTMAGDSTGSSNNGGILSTLSSFISEFTNRAWDGVLTGNYNTDYSSFSSGTSGSYPTLSMSTTATNLTDELVEKTLQITQAGEGLYDSVNRNDNGAYSVGIMQFHDQRAKNYFTRLSNSLSNPADKAIALKYANMYKQPLSVMEASQLKSWLNRPEIRSVAEPLQKTYAMEILKGSNMKTAFEMYESGILKDPRSVVLISDIANTGPAHINTWRDLYKPTTKEQELAHVRDSLKSKDSYWGRATGSQYYKGWMNRIDKTYNTLATWTPKFDPSRNAAAGFGDQEEIDSVFKMANINQMPTLQGGFGDNDAYSFNPSYEAKEKVSYKSGGNDRIFDAVSDLNRMKDNTDDTVLIQKIDKIINVLLSIDSNSEDVSKKIQDLRNSVTSVNITSNRASNPVVVNAGGNNTNLQIGQPSKNQELAKKIASGS